MSTTLPAVIEAEIIGPRVPALASQADSDRHLVHLWLGRHASRHTRRNYARGLRLDRPARFPAG